MTEQRLQGTDITVEFTLKDANANPILPSSLNDYVVEIFTFGVRNAKTPLLKFKKTPGVGEYQVNIINDAAGIINIIIPRAWTKTATPIKLYAEIKTKQTADSSYEASKMVAGVYAFEICDLVTSSIPTEIA